MSASTHRSNMPPANATNEEDAFANVNYCTEPLRVSSDTLNFVSLLFADDLQPVLFEESLVTFSDINHEVGKFSVSICSTEHECIEVKSSSSGVIDGVPCGSVLSACLSRTGQTLEQNHFQYVKLEDDVIERRTILRREDNRYLIECNVKHAEEVKTTASCYTLEEMEGVFPEGSNLLMLRLLVQKGLPTEGLSLLTFNPDMIICPVHYRSLEHEVETVGDREVTLIGIERTATCDNQQMTWQSYFTADSHLVRRVQVGSAVSVRLCQMSTEQHGVEESKDESVEKPKFEKQTLDWEKDLELKSKFIDRKEELTASHAAWMRQHPELHALVADFVQHVLFKKPDNVIEESAGYFATFR